MTSSARSLFLLAARLYRRVLLDDCLVKLQPWLEFVCYYYQNRFSTTQSLFWILYISWCFCGVFSCGLFIYNGETLHRCSLMISTWDDHPAACVKCRFSAGIYNMDIHNPCSISQSWSTITWGKLRKSLRDVRQKSTKHLDGLYQLRFIFGDWLNC